MLHVFRRNMQRQIEQVLENLRTLSQEKSNAIKNILSRYVNGEIGLDETYYELMDNDLIPMPQRCTMFVKHETSPEEEENFKNYIRNKII
jgi:hypothetical protein